MPFLRTIRDKRGYETTYLIESLREGNRQRSQILYLFRTPGGVRGGRVALEPEARQQLELSHPAIAFDWKAIMAERQVVDDSPDPRRARRPRRSETTRAATPPAQARRAAPEKPQRPPIPSTIDGSTPDARIAFLALWYPIVRDQIPARASDPARQETLLALAERLNPTAWTDADEIAAGLQGATEALDRLSRVFSKRRRRSRRSTRSAEPATTESPVVAVNTEAPREVPADAANAVHPESKDGSTEGGGLPPALTGD
ncbi:MAG: hypothetical protein O2930_09190 [Acidobacteria bacterium]|nr:hypothetical protein [Acidobacteriota bacterium]